MKGLRKRCYCLLVILVSVVTSGFSAEYQRFTYRGKFGVRTSDGRTIIPAKYEGIGWSDGRFSVNDGVTGYKQDGKWGLISIQQAMVTQPLYQQLTAYTDSRGRTVYTAQQASYKTGIINNKGEARIPFIYDDIRAADDRLILMIRRQDRWIFGLSDLDHRIILPPEWAAIKPAGRSLFGVTSTQRKTALYTRDGMRTTEFLFDSIGSFIGKFLTVYSGTYTGIVGQDGKIIRYPAFKEAVSQSDGSMKLIRYDRWVVLNRKLEEIRSTEADSIVPFERNFLRIVRGTRVGLVTAMLKEWWATEYDVIRSGPGSAWITGKNGRLGLTKPDGSLLTEQRYDSILTLGQTTVVVTGKGEHSRWQVLDTNTGKTTGQPVERIEPVNDLLKIRAKGFEGLADLKGNILLEPVYESILQLSTTSAAVRFLGKFGIVDLNGRWILLPQDHRPELIGDGLYILSSPNKFQLFNTSGNLLLSATHPLVRAGNELHEMVNSTVLGRYTLNGTPIRTDQRTMTSLIQADQNPDTAPLFPVTEGLQGFMGNGKYGFRDTHGTLRIPNRYDSIVPFSEGLAAVKLNGRWGFLDANDKLVFQPRFDLSSRFVNGVAPVRLHGKYGVLARDGFRLQPEYDELTPTADGRYFILKKDGRYGLSDSNGTLLIEARYDYLDPVGGDQVIVKDRLYGIINTRGMGILPIAFGELWFLPGPEVFIGRQSGNEEVLIPEK